MAKNMVKGSPKLWQKEAKKGRKLGHTRAVQKKRKRDGKKSTNGAVMK